MPLIAGGTSGWGASSEALSRMRQAFVICILVALKAAKGEAAPPNESATVPAGTILQIRLRQTLSSHSSDRGDRISAILIAPVVISGQIVIPMRTELRGEIRDVHKIGLGFSRETALLDLRFHRIQIPGQEEQDVVGLVSKVDDARETVDDRGRVRGIRATESFSSTISGFAIGLASFDPMALMFALSGSLSVFRVPNSSIVFPAGTELRYRLQEPLTVSGSQQAPYADLLTSEATRTAFVELVRPMPFRTSTEGGNEPSDLTSLLYIGSAETLERAFLAAGWVRSDRLDAKSKYGAMRSIIENQGYSEAPMSTLLLNGQRPELSYAKTLNTFFTRHHLRIYSQNASYEGRPLWTGTATHDSGIGFSKSAKTFIHLIDENIDEERSKIVNDLVLTGCVDSVGYLDRSWVPLDAKNATGDALLTDGKIAIINFNECREPVSADTPETESKHARETESAVMRPVQSTVLTLRSDLIRSNVIYQGYAGTKLALQGLRKGDPDSTQPRSFRYGGQQFYIVKGARPEKYPDIPEDPGARVQQEELERPRTYATRLMFSFGGGLSGFGNPSFSKQPLVYFVSTPGTDPVPTPVTIEDRLTGGWTLEPKIALNSWRYISTELAYTFTTTSFGAVADLPMTDLGFNDRSDARIRRFTGNVLFHLRPNGSRIRPYLAVGPALQLIHLLDSEPSRNRFLRFASRDVALLVSAYDFGRKPPLEGGGIFQFGLNYGGGVQFHLSPRYFLRADFRETLSGQPDFWTKSHKTIESGSDPLVRIQAAPLIKDGPLRHQLVTIGMGVAF